jgi:hypothetical protein
VLWHTRNLKVFLDFDKNKFLITIIVKNNSMNRLNVVTACIFFFHWHYSPLWVLACQTMFLRSVLSSALSIFSLPTVEDLFLLLLSILSWAFLFVSSLPVLK